MTGFEIGLFVAVVIMYITQLFIMIDRTEDKNTLTNKIAEQETFNALISKGLTRQTERVDAVQLDLKDFKILADNKIETIFKAVDGDVKSLAKKLSGTNELLGEVAYAVKKLETAPPAPPEVQDIFIKDSDVTIIQEDDDTPPIMDDMTGTFFESAPMVRNPVKRVRKKK